VLLHEAFHAAAARRIGLRSRFRIGRRFYSLVAETVMDGLVAVPRRQRYLPVLAGPLADLLFFSVLTLAAAGTGVESPAGAFFRALAFAALLRLAWQFQFYLRTDLYVLISTVLGLGDLHRVSWNVLRGWAARLLRREPAAPDPGGWSRREWWHARWYAPLLLVGYAISLAMLAGVLLPASAHVVAVIYRRLVDPAAAGTGGLVDALLVLAISAGQLAAVIAIARRERRRATPTRTTSEEKP
jgi:hypothetical protein